MTRTFLGLVVLLGLWTTALPQPARGADNELTADEKVNGWLLLFDGKSLDGWQTSSQKPSQRPVETGASTRIAPADTC